MTKRLYLDDCYLKEFDAIVTEVVQDRFIVLNQTAFYPNMGGQPNDTGTLKRSDGRVFSVISVSKTSDAVRHEISESGLVPGDRIHGTIDWNRRYSHMRMHTAAHVLARTLYDRTGAFTSGNQLGSDRSRIDFTLDDFDKDIIQDCISKANEIAAQALPITISSMAYDDAMMDNQFSAPSKHLMPNIPEVRVINIEGFDRQACGGTHLSNTNEIGWIEYVKADNKGKSNRRVYFTLTSISK
jgi:misacylated tRNA(Ala) deacylase